MLKFVVESEAASTKPPGAASAGKPVLLALLAIMVMSGWRVIAQVPTAAITGTVLDPQGLPVAGAEVTVINQGTKAEYKAKTSDLGAFRVPSLPSGLYTVRATAASFKVFEATDIKLDAGTDYSIPPISLVIGSATQTVTVEAGAQLVQTVAQVSGTVERRQIQDLPILDRNVLNLLQLQAGVNNSGPNGTFNTVIDGQRTSYGNMTLDGINIQDNFIRSNALDFSPARPRISQSAEFTVVQQNGGADAGLGASQVSFITPSGTNNWHGEGFWYHRNNAVSSSDWFANAAGQDSSGNPRVPKQRLIRNQGGGNIGGRIIKDKLFIYGFYELVRHKSQQTTNTTVLTSTARQGLFTYIPTCTTNCPSGVTPGVPNTINVLTAKTPPLPIDSYVSGLLGTVPTSINNFDTGDSTASQLFNTAGFRFQKRSNRTEDKFGTRVDFNPRQRHNITGTFSWVREVVDRPDIDRTFNLAPKVDSESHVPLLSAAWRWTPRDNLTNELRGGFLLSSPVFNTTEDFSKGFLPCNTTLNCGGGTGVNTFLFTDPVTNFQKQGRNTNTYSFQDNANYVRGNHSIKFGWLSQLIRVRSFTTFNIPPLFAIGLSGVNTRGLGQGNFPGGISTAALNRANSLLSSLAGFVSSGAEEFNVTSRTSGFVPGASNVRQFPLNDLSFYGADSWRVRKNLTFNYGVRWEYVGRFDESDGLLLAPVINPSSPDNPFRPSPSQAVRTLLDPNVVIDFAGSGTGRPLYNRDLNNFGPNIGLAWDPWGNGKTSIRAGYSISYVNDEAIRAADNATANNAGLNSVITQSNLVATFGGGLPSFQTPTVVVPHPLTLIDQQNGGTPQAVFTADPNYRTPYVQQWNLSVSRDLGHNTVLEARYVGNHGLKLGRVLDYNQVLIGPNGFLADFLRARQNGFLALAATGTFNPAFNASIAGSQPLTVFPNLAGGGLLTNATIRNEIQTGQAGDLAFVYFLNGLAGSVPLAPSSVAQVGDLLQNFSGSTYHAGTVEVRRRWSRGIYFQANYTWSKVLTDSGGESQTLVDTLMDVGNPQLDRGRASFDIAQAFKANYVYELPVGKGHRFSSSNHVLGKLLAGWSAGSIFTWQSGAPFSIVSNRGTVNRATRSTGKNTAVALGSDPGSSVGLFKEGNGVFMVNPSILGPDGRGTGDDAINCSSTAFTGMIFCNPSPGTFGNLGRRAFNGPTFFNWDFSLLKKTPVTERVNAEFRAEFFNFLNHPTFGSNDPTNGAVDQNINSTNFGRISSTISTPRVIQFALRLTF